MRREVVGMSEVNKLGAQFSKVEGAKKRRMPGIVLKRLEKEKSKARAEVGVHLLMERSEETTFTIIDTSKGTL